MSNKLMTNQLPTMASDLTDAGGVTEVEVVGGGLDRVTGAKVGLLGS